MSGTEGSGEGAPLSEPAKEATLLPILGKAKERTLADIEKNRKRLVDNVLLKLAGEQDVMHRGIRELLDEHSNRGGTGAYTTFLEGVTTAFTALQHQAEISKTPLPIVSDDVWNAQLQNRAETRRIVTGENPTVSDPGVPSGVRDAQKTYEDDEVFRDLVDEVTKYRAFNVPIFQDGANVVYSAIHAAWQAEEMEKHFGEH